MSLVTRVSLGIVLGAAALLAPALTAAAQMNITINDNFFSTPDLSVNAGDTVVWRNVGATSHTVTANDGSFNSGTIVPGASFSYTFTAPGTYSYHCSFHPMMTGTITVGYAAYTPPAPTPSPYYYPYNPQPPVYTYNPQPPVYTYNPPTYGQSSVDDLRARAQALLARIQQLQAQLGYASGGGLSFAPAVPRDSGSCPLIGRVLKLGSMGEDVTRLQQFLARDPSIYPESRISGYYGAITEAAVKRWQAKFNIVSSGASESTGYGVVGPRTAAAIALLCAGGGGGGAAPQVGGFIQVTPVSGNAPLSVAVQATVNTVNSCSGGTYLLDYGDGSPPVQILAPSGNCQQMVQNLSHQYAYGGTYLVTLSAGAHSTSATVQVFGGGAPSPTPTPSPNPQPSAPAWGIISVTPAAGGDPLSASIDFQYPACTSYSIDWGDSTLPTTTGSASNCQSGTNAEGTNGHTYAGSGAYTISLRDGSGVVRATSGITISN